MKSILRWVTVILLSAILGTAAVCHCRPGSQTLYGNADGSREKFILKEQQLQVFVNGNQIWHSPSNWRIKQIQLADADNNNQEEVLLVLWKKGSYGKSKPFWFKGTDNKYTCHLFLYKIQAGKFKAVWCSSALENPIIRLDVKDSNNDGRNELNITEGPHSGFAYSIRQCFIQHKTRWIWNGWGFEKA